VSKPCFEIRRVWGCSLEDAELAGGTGLFADKDSGLHDSGIKYHGRYFAKCIITNLILHPKVVSVVSVASRLDICVGKKVRKKDGAVEEQIPALISHDSIISLLECGVLPRNDPDKGKAACAIP